jgi:hypothetical protein
MVYGDFMQKTRVFSGRGTHLLRLLASLISTTQSDTAKLLGADPTTGWKHRCFFVTGCLARLDDGPTLLNSLLNEMLDLMLIELYLQGIRQMFE